MVIRLALLLIVLLAQSCGAWDVPASFSRLAIRRLNVRPAATTAMSTFYNNSCSCDRAILRRSSQRWKLALLRGLTAGEEARAGAPSRAVARTRTRATGADNVNGEESAVDNNSGGRSDSSSVVIKARLRKPVGLVLAEKEKGKPGLVVDDMVEGGSAKASGAVQRGMTLVSACGVDCGALVFDEVVEMLQNSPPEEPIDFVFSTTAAELASP